MRAQPFARRPVRARSEASRTIFASVDGSIYQASVCDHAAWFSPRTHGGIELVCTSADTGAPPEEVLESASARLHDNGAEAQAQCSVREALPPTIARIANGSDLVVVGRAGAGRSTARREIARETMELIEQTHCAVCVTPRVFLPIDRGLVLTIAGSGDDEFAEALATCPWLDGLSVTIGALPAAANHPAAAERSQANEPHGWSGRPSDLIILSRKHLSRTGSTRLIPAVRCVLSLRVPLLVL